MLPDYKKRPSFGGLCVIGSPGRTRTADPVINSHLLYQLSYRGKVECCVSLLGEIRIVLHGATSRT